MLHRVPPPLGYTIDFSYLFDSDLEEEVVVEEKPVEAPIPKRKKSKLRLSDRYYQQIPERGTDGINVKKNMGARKWRRIENGRLYFNIYKYTNFLARILLSFVNSDDLNDEYSDFMPDTISAFAKLFLDQENMKVIRLNLFYYRGFRCGMNLLRKTKKNSVASWRRLIRKASLRMLEIRSEESRLRHPTNSTKWMTMKKELVRLFFD